MDAWHTCRVKIFGAGDALAAGHGDSPVTGRHGTCYNS